MEGNLKWSLVTAVAPVAWGTTYFVTREYLPESHPLYGAAFRAVPAGLLLLAVCRKLPHGSWWWKSLVLGALNMSGFFALVYVAAQRLPTSLASIIMALAPLFMMMLAWPLVGERPGWKHLAGAMTGVGGVCLMVFTAAGSVDEIGVLASVGAMALSSYGYVLAKRWSGEVDVLAATSWQLLGGGLLLVPCAALVEGPPPALDGPALLGFGYLAVVATGIAFAAWFLGLKHLPAGTVGLLGLLNPVTGVLLGLLLAGESLSGRQVLGLVLTLCGVVLGQRAARTPAPPPEAPEPPEPSETPDPPEPSEAPEPPEASTPTERPSRITPSP